MTVEESLKELMKYTVDCRSFRCLDGECPCYGEELFRESDGTYTCIKLLIKKFVPQHLRSIPTVIKVTPEEYLLILEQFVDSQHGTGTGNICPHTTCSECSFEKILQKLLKKERTGCFIGFEHYMSSHFKEWRK